MSRLNTLCTNVLEDFDCVFLVRDGVSRHVDRIGFCLKTHETIWADREPENCLQRPPQGRR